MFLQSLVDQGADLDFLEELFERERYAWMTLAPSMAAVIDLDGAFVAVNHRWERFVGFHAQELHYSYLLEYMHIEDREKTLAEMQSLITADMASASFVFRFQCKDESYKRLNWNIFFSPEHEAFFCTVHDASARDLDTLASYAYKDALTGLYNRLYLTDRFPDILSQAQANEWSTVIIFIDLDGFKQVNDTHGHNVGDMLLMEVADRMGQCLKQADMLVRLGGDEFVAVSSGPYSREDAGRLADSLIQSVALPYIIEGEDLEIGASAGVSLYPQHSEDPDALLQMADEAMYCVKRSGKNNYRFYGVSS